MSSSVKVLPGVPVVVETGSARWFARFADRGQAGFVGPIGRTWSAIVPSDAPASTSLTISDTRRCSWNRFQPFCGTFTTVFEKTIPSGIGFRWRKKRRFACRCSCCERWGCRQRIRPGMDAAANRFFPVPNRPRGWSMTGRYRPPVRRRLRNRCPRVLSGSIDGGDKFRPRLVLGRVVDGASGSTSRVNPASWRAGFGRVRFRSGGRKSPTWWRRFLGDSPIPSGLHERGPLPPEGRLVDVWWSWPLRHAGDLADHGFFDR